jgi:hypothetical protein
MIHEDEAIRPGSFRHNLNGITNTEVDNGIHTAVSGVEPSRRPWFDINGRDPPRPAGVPYGLRHDASAQTLIGSQLENLAPAAIRQFIELQRILDTQPTLNGRSNRVVEKAWSGQQGAAIPGVNSGSKKPMMGV